MHLTAATNSFQVKVLLGCDAAIFRQHGPLKR